MTNESMPWEPRPEHQYDGTPSDIGPLPADVPYLIGVQVTTGFAMERDGSGMQPLTQLYLKLVTLNNQQLSSQLIMLDEKALSILHAELSGSLTSFKLMRMDGIIK